VKTQVLVGFSRGNQSRFSICFFLSGPDGIIASAEFAGKKNVSFSHERQS